MQGIIPASAHAPIPLGAPAAGQEATKAIVWGARIRSGVVVSQRGGDFELMSGQDLSLGYRSSDAESVTLYFEESFTLKILDSTAAAAVVSEA